MWTPVRGALPEFKEKMLILLERELDPSCLVCVFDCFDSGLPFGFEGDFARIGVNTGTRLWEDDLPADIDVDGTARELKLVGR
jgi:hypothetical protein